MTSYFTVVTPGSGDMATRPVACMTGSARSRITRATRNTASYTGPNTKINGGYSIVTEKCTMYAKSTR